MTHNLFLMGGFNLALGLLLGAIGGLFGIGGGLIAIPVLSFVYGMDQQLAQGTALVMIVPNVAIGFWRYKQRNGIALKSAVAMAVPAVVMTYFSAHLAISLNSSTLRTAFALFMGALALYYIWTLTRPVKVVRAQPLIDHKYLFAVGFAAGVSSGFFSIGGAIVAVPLLVVLFGLTQTAAQGLGLAMVLPGTVVALVTYASAGHVDWQVGVPLAIGGLFSISWGVALAHHLPERRLRAMFCAALLLISISMLAHG